MTTNLKECFRCNLLYVCPSQQIASKPHKNPTNTGQITKNLIISPPYAHKNLGSTLRTKKSTCMMSINTRTNPHKNKSVGVFKW
jgi:hypothetical protein